jgi:hypothetical protein
MSRKPSTFVVEASYFFNFNFQNSALSSIIFYFFCLQPFNQCSFQSLEKAKESCSNWSLLIALVFLTSFGLALIGSCSFFFRFNTDFTCFFFGDGLKSESSAGISTSAISTAMLLAPSSNYRRKSGLALDQIRQPFFLWPLFEVFFARALWIAFFWGTIHLEFELQIACCFRVVWPISLPFPFLLFLQLSFVLGSVSTLPLLMQLFLHPSTIRLNSRLLFRTSSQPYLSPCS